MYGKENTGVVVLFGTTIVPLNNILAVAILEFYRKKTVRIGKITLAVLKSPMVCAVLLAFLCKILRLTLSNLLYSAISDLASVTTTISFLSLEPAWTEKQCKGTGDL